MDLPIYYSFKDFEINYKNDFENWSKYLPDAIEKDYLFELKEKYSPFVRWSGNYIFNDFHIEITLNKEDNLLSILDFANFLTDKYIEFNNSEIDEFNQDLKAETDFKIILSNLIFGEIVDEKNGFYFEFKNLDFYLYFYEMVTFIINDKVNYKICLDERKYKNFKFSVVKIAEYIDEKIKPPTKELIKISEIVTPEIEPKSKTPFTTPEKIALLQITGLENYFDTLTGDIADQKYRLLSTLFGVSFDTVKKCYLNNSITGLHKKRAKDFFNNKFN